MLHIFNCFKHMSSFINVNSSILNRILNPIQYRYKNIFLLRKNINENQIKKYQDSDIFLFDFLFFFQLDKRIIVHTSSSLLNDNIFSNFKIKDRNFYNNYCKKKLFIPLNKKKNKIKLKVNQSIKRNNLFFYFNHKKKMLNKILSFNTNINFLKKESEVKKKIFFCLNFNLNNFKKCVSSKNAIVKNFKESTDNIFLLEKKYNEIPYFSEENIFFVKKKTNKKFSFKIFNKNNFMDFTNKNNFSLIGKKNNLSFFSYVKLNFSYMNKIWKKIINYEKLNKIHNTEYVVDFKLNQEYLGLLVFKLKMNCRDKIAKFFIFSKNDKICTFLKSSISFLKDIFRKNSIKLSEITINNKNCSQCKNYKNKKQNFNNLVKASILKKENEKINSVFLYNRDNFQNIFFASNKIDIYA
ncbi:hypothetical protein [Buchnera aphidicola]|uniref:hypothetical protein n=1 Tax=Buchnera aphidicola TaxID=9 RepID=UPI003463ECF2